MDPSHPIKSRSIDIVAFIWLRSALFVALFISAFGALVSFRCLFIYAGITSGYLDVSEGSPEYQLYQIIQRHPAIRLSLESFNLILWTSVLIGSTYLLRFREWARLLVKIMITADLILTLGVALAPVILSWIYQKPIKSEVGVDLFITTLEVAIVLVLSHPRVISLTTIRPGRNGEPQRVTGTQERRPDETR